MDDPTSPPRFRPWAGAAHFQASVSYDRPRARARDDQNCSSEILVRAGRDENWPWREASFAGRIPAHTGATNTPQKMRALRNGGSPCARARRLNPPSFADSFRIIPARTGATVTDRVTLTSREDHPRAHGRDPSPASSPRAASPRRRPFVVPDPESRLLPPPGGPGQGQRPASAAADAFPDSRRPL
jgi:hypothetical protein